MSYDKALVSNRQKAVIKSITDLLEVLSEIDIDDASDNGGEIVLDDGSVMTLSVTTDKSRNSLNVKTISLSNATLNLDILIKKANRSVLSQNDTVIRLVKRKTSGDSNKIVIKLKKKDN